MTVEDLENNMSWNELEKWHAYFKIRNKLEKASKIRSEAEAKAKSQANKKPRRKGRGG